MLSALLYSWNRIQIFCLYDNWNCILLHICHCVTDFFHRSDQWPLFVTWLKNSIPVWISNPIDRKMWNGITYPFPNFNGCTFEVWKWISNFIPYFAMLIPVSKSGPRSCLNTLRTLGSGRYPPDGKFESIPFKENVCIFVEILITI